MKDRYHNPTPEEVLGPGLRQIGLEGLERLHAYLKKGGRVLMNGAIVDMNIEYG